MPEPWLYLKAIVASAIASALFALALLGPRWSSTETRLKIACVLGIGFGLVVGYYVLGWRFAWPPFNGLDRFLTFILPAILTIELIAGFERMPSWSAWLLRLSLAASIPRILLHGSVYLTSHGTELPIWQAGMRLLVCSGLLASLWWLLLRLSQRSPGVSISLSLCLAIQCTGLTVMLAGYIKGGAAALPVVATILSATIVVALVSKRLSSVANFGEQSIIGIGAVSLFGLLFIGYFFGRLSTGSTLTMLFSPLLCWASEIAVIRNRAIWLVGAVQLTLVAIPLSVVLSLAKRDFDRDMAPLLYLDRRADGLAWKGLHGKPTVNRFSGNQIDGNSREVDAFVTEKTKYDE